MSSTSHQDSFDHSELVHLYAVQALAADEAAAFEAHLEGCEECRRELEELGPVMDALVEWPKEVVLRPTTPLWARVAERIEAPAETRAPEGWNEPEWRDVGGGISVKLLAFDSERRRVSMLVRLEPGAAYPPHSHAGIEELHLLEGVLIVDDRTLYPGDYLRSEIGTADARVYSETGCACVLVTSLDDELRWASSADAIVGASVASRGAVV